MSVLLNLTGLEGTVIIVKMEAISIFEHDEYFKAVERAKDREDLFEDYVEEHEKKRQIYLDIRLLDVSQPRLTDASDVQSWCAINVCESHNGKDRLEADERCSLLEKIDRLEIFQEYICDLESKEEEQRKLRMEELRKSERKNRDEFRKLMEEHVVAGIINGKTNWRDYCIKIKDFAAYLAVSSNTSGSTAKDLFTEVMDELEKPVK
ncbi:hypothetical protein BC332_33509 [Capsicum chinense]|nr:hypothetical protein BC332_33509 [Capsicum chinense]